MGKLLNVSLFASMVLSSSLYAQSIIESIEASTVKGEVKTEYSNSNYLGKTDADDIWAAGASLNVITGDFYGFKLGATLQASSVLSEDNNGGVFANDLNGSGVALSEAYIDYSLANTNLKLGRQYIYTPLVSTAIDGKSSESVLKDSFNAYVLTNADIPNTTVVAGYINKYQAKTDGNSNEGDFERFQDGAYTIYAKNTSIENLTLQAQYLNENGVTSSNDKSALYFQADYQLSAHTLSAQFLKSKDKTQAANAQDGKLFGLRAMGPLGLGKAGYLLAFNTSTDDNGPLYLGAGAGTTDTPFTALPVHGGGVPVRANTDTLVGGVVIPVLGATVIPYVGQSASKTHALGDVNAMGAMVIYPVNKQLVVKVNFENVDIEKTMPKSTDTTRIYLSYKF